MIRVMVVDDHPVVRRGLEGLLGAAADLEVLPGATAGADAVARAESEAPDVILMDLSMPGMDGVEATRRVLGVAPACRVVVLTSFSDRELILAALDAGAAGYLFKDAEPDAIAAAVRAAARGEAPLAPKAAQALVEARERPRSLAPRLSAREREVLVLVAAGKPNKLIARDLGISEKTVKAHLTRVFSELGVTDRTQAALWAQRRGLGSG